MPFLTRSLLVTIGLVTFSLCTSYGAEQGKGGNTGSSKEGRTDKQPLHVVVRSQADIKQKVTPALKLAVQALTAWLWTARVRLVRSAS
jgi:hypothetical protein